MIKYLIFLLLLSNLREFLGTVLRGTRVEEGQFPWLIQFHKIIPCGGVLISPDWVLTAAQCVKDNRYSIELYGTGLNGTRTSQTIGVKATYMFPKFQAYSKDRDYDNNIALLKLKRAFDMCDGKVRLPDIAHKDKLDDDYEFCLIFGWQSTVAPTTNKVHAKPVRYSKVLLNTWHICTYITHQGNASYKHVFCTIVEDDNGVRACAGNPGSPVVCEDRFQRMSLVGIASWSNFSLGCGGLPTYLRVSDFRSWMWDLIFGNKNIEQWESGMKNQAGVCQRESLGGLYGESNLHPQVQKYPEADDFSERKQISREDNDDDEAYAISTRLTGRRVDNSPKISTKRISGQGKIPYSRGKVDMPIYDDSDDYTKILGENGARKTPDFDVVRERDEILKQYREIGKNSNGGIEEPIAVPSQQEKQVIIVENPVKKIRKFKEESFDDLALILLDGIEDLDRSCAATFIPYSNFLKILLMCFWIIFNT